MHFLAALIAAGVIVVGAADSGFATVQLEAPVGAELVIDGQSVATVGRDGRVELRLSAVPHRIVVRQNGRVLQSQDVTFGAGSRIRLKMT